MGVKAEVNISLDIRRFEAALSDWSQNTVTATESAALDAAEYLKERVRAKLLEYAHPFEEPTAAPTFKGPVGSLTTGGGYGRYYRIPFHLRDSVEITIMPIRGFTKVTANAAYARIQELGGWTGTGHMTWLSPRPFFRPTVQEIDTRGPGGFEHIFWEHWRWAMKRAVAF